MRRVVLWLTRAEKLLRPRAALLAHPEAFAGRKIGPDHEPYVICELSGNHNGSLDRALALVDASDPTWQVLSLLRKPRR